MSIKFSLPFTNQASHTVDISSWILYQQIFEQCACYYLILFACLFLIVHSQYINVVWTPISTDPWMLLYQVKQETTDHCMLTYLFIQLKITHLTVSMYHMLRLHWRYIHYLKMNLSTFFLNKNQRRWVSFKIHKVSKIVMLAVITVCTILLSAVILANSSHVLVCI